MAEFSKTFASAKKWVIGQAKKFLPVIVGIPESVLATVSNKYVVTLTASFGGKAAGFGEGGREFTVHGYLQEKIVLDSTSNWQGLTQDIPGADFLINQADKVTQAIGGISAITTVSTRRKWAGSSPITLTLKLKFEAEYDVEKEVLWPCMGLQGLTLPRGGYLGAIGIIPPGPSPFTFNKNELARGEQITVQVGDFLTFNSVIVKDVKVVYENRMTEKGPVGAEVDITIETYEMLTREGLQKAYGEVFSTTKDMGKLGTTVANIATRYG